MRVKYNRVSTIQQSGARFENDVEKYDKTFFDKISGSVKFADRPKAKELIELIEDGKVSELVVEELSRLGRNTGDVISTLEWLETQDIKVRIRNLDMSSRMPDGKPNQMFKLLSTILSSVYELEKDSILERTKAGKAVYVQNGGKLGRPDKSVESEKSFIAKPKNQKILDLLKRGRTIREIAKIADCSTSTVVKVKKVATKQRLLEVAYEKRRRNLTAGSRIK